MSQAGIKQEQFAACLALTAYVAHFNREDGTILLLQNVSELLLDLRELHAKG
jgi:hypothetical protein